jgi:uncharacterized protein YbbK (DUF523 family)
MTKITTTNTTTSARSPKPVIGIGSCLAGNAVRYNGETNSPNQHVREIFQSFECQPFCPEMGIGLGVPRPPIHLVSSKEAVRILDVQTHTHDYTDQIQAYAQSVLDQAPLLCGYILVKGSPSCGYRSVKRYSEEGQYLASDQHGIFAAALGNLDPLLPLEDDESLENPQLRDSFVTRVHTYREWKTLTGHGLTAQSLVDFYSRYKDLVATHPVPDHRNPGAVLANRNQQPLDKLAPEFIRALMAALASDGTGDR